MPASELDEHCEAEAPHGADRAAGRETGLRRVDPKKHTAALKP